MISITIPNSVTEIKDFAFDGCKSLTSIAIPNSITVIGGNVFEDCIGLTSVSIPNSVTTIGSSAFRACTGLTSITIPNSVTEIKNWAFAGCTELTRVICQATTPPSTGAYFFSSWTTTDIYKKAALYVPAESIEAYRAHAGWGKFTRIVPFIGAGPGDVDGDGNISIGDVTNLIDMLINGDAPAYADVNGDGQISIGDITALIDKLLGVN